MSRMNSRIGGKVTGQGRLIRRRGGAVLELALTLSILFSICYGLIECGYYFYVKNTLEGAAREGCRAGIVTGGSTAACNAAIKNQLQAANLVSNTTTASGSGGTYTIGNYTVTYQDNGTTISGDVSAIPTGDTLTVNVSGVWSVVGAGFRPAAIISGNHLMGSSAMRVEG